VVPCTTAVHDPGQPQRDAVDEHGPLSLSQDRRQVLGLQRSPTSGSAGTVRGYALCPLRVIRPVTSGRHVQDVGDRDETGLGLGGPPPAEDQRSHSNRPPAPVRRASSTRAKRGKFRRLVSRHPPPVTGGRPTLRRERRCPGRGGTETAKV